MVAVRVRLPALEEVDDVQLDAERQFAKLTASLVEAQEQLTRRAGDR